LLPRQWHTGGKAKPIFQIPGDVLEPERISIFGQPKHCVPKGPFENSTAFERRGLTVSQQVPQGRLKKRLPRRSLGEDGFFSAVPAGLGVFQTYPGIEMPGYFRWFLRNRTAA
jgi:hypothetical protein